MKKRIADSLKEFGYQVTVDDFHTALTEVKAQWFGRWSIDELIITRDEAAEYCQLRKRLSTLRLTRVFILRSLVGLRKNGGARRKAVASLQDGQAAI